MSAAEGIASTSQAIGDVKWLETDLGRPPAQRRTRLPDPVQELPGINLWSLIKDWIGKDIHKLALPTHINEPLTDLQRRAEAFETSELLDEVSCTAGSIAPACSFRYSTRPIILGIGKL